MPYHERSLRSTCLLKGDCSFVLLLIVIDGGHPEIESILIDASALWVLFILSTKAFGQ